MNMGSLITVIITSTAAIVAIIGGFLVSRVITLASEKNSIERKLKEINSDLSAKESMLEQVNIEILEEDIDSFIYDYSKDIIIENKNIEEIIEDDDNYDFSIDELIPYLREFNSITDTVINWMRDVDSFPKDFDEFLKNNELKVEKRKEWYKLAYDTIWDKVPENSPKNPFELNFDLTPALTSTNLVNSFSISRSYENKLKEQKVLSNDVEILKLRKAEQEKILDDYAKPVGLWGGFWVLVYACSVGIVYPSTLLPFQEGIYNDVTTKWFLLFLFFSELITLFMYLGISMRKLTTD